MSKRDFARSARELGAALDGPMPEATARRVSARLSGQRPRRRVRWVRLGGAGVLLAAAAWAALVLYPGRRELGGFALLAQQALRADETRDGAVVVVAGRCLLEDVHLGAVVQVTSPAQLRREPSGARVERGRVDFEVKPGVLRPTPYRVRVSHGVIEVLGTRFVVTQDEGGGQVELLRGRVRFVYDDGETVTLEPTQTLRWPRAALATAPELSAPSTAPAVPPLVPAPSDAVAHAAPKAAPATSPTPSPGRTPARAGEPSPRGATSAGVAAPPTPSAASTATSAEALLDQVAVLRSRGAYEAAAELLRAGLEERSAQGAADATAERLSYELGSLLGNQLALANEACAHWKVHRARFGGGRYDVEVERAWARLGCGP